MPPAHKGWFEFALIRAGYFARLVLFHTSGDKLAREKSSVSL